jgi:riboflavin kinase/FMN adenylyltransferase
MEVRLKGKVVKGHALGRQIGFPTANLELDCVPELDCGVFAARVFLSKIWYLAAVNYGNRKTFEDQSRSFEVHLLDFSGDLYSEILEVLIDFKIRDVRKFASVDELKSQIAKDVEFVRSFYAAKL